MRSCPSITNDLNEYWPQLLAAENITLPALTVVPVQSADDDRLRRPGR